MKHFCKLITCFLCPFILAAQHKNIRFESLSANLDDIGAISKIVQDKKGFLWISTFHNGLFRFDGYTTTRYSYDPFDPASVPQNQIYTFFIDSKDTIWVGTAEGLCKFDRLTEKFIRYNSSLINDMPDLRNVGAINEDLDGNLWIGNFEGELWRYNKRTGEFSSLTSKLNYNADKGLGSDFHEAILYIYKDNKGIIWVGSSNGLYKVNNSVEISFTHYQNDPDNSNSLSNVEISNIYEDKTGIIWIGTSEGLNSLDPSSGKFNRYLPDKLKSYSISNKSLATWGTGIVEDQDNNLWIGTSNGLNKLNKERTVFTSYFQDESNEFGLRSSTIYTLCLDAANNLFVATGDGIQSVTLSQKEFGLLQNDLQNKNSISSNDVTSVLEDSNGSVWIGTSNGLNYWDRKSDQIFRYQDKVSGGLKSKYVSDLLEYPEGVIWICNGDYLSRLNTASHKFEHFYSNTRSLTNFDAKTIYSICHDNFGLLWMGTGNGIKSFDPVTKKFTHYFFDAANPDGISDYTVLGILADSRDNIWVCNNSIAFDKFNKRTGKFTHYKNNPLDSTSISANITCCVYEDSKGNLWIGTYGGGLCQYNYTTDNFITHSRNKDVPWNSVFSIQEDNSGNLWLGTDKGISCYLVSEEKFINYDIKDGLQGNVFSAGWRGKGSSSKGKNGDLYFGGGSGLNYFDPLKIHLNEFVPAVVITQFKIFDKLQPGKNEAKEIVLDYNQNFFSFEFAALNYTNASKNKYAYQLEGIDKDWIFCGARRYAGYTNLDPGSYTFRVKGSNNDGIWNDEGVSMKLFIRPPWWRTNPAYFIYGLILFGAAIAIHRYQKNRVVQIEREKAQKNELAQAKVIEKAYHQLKETQAQLVQQEKMASLGALTAGIAHEIQNPLNFVNNFSEVSAELIQELKTELASGNRELASEIAHDISQNLEKINHHGKRADGIVKSMLLHSQKSSGQKELTDINALCDEYLRLAYHGLRAKDQNFNARFSTAFDEALPKIRVVPQDIGKVILNLMNNAFYAVNEKTNQNISGYEPTVIVSTKKENGRVIIAVEDNGTGIPENVKEKIFQPFFTTKPTGQGTGLGLSLAYDIIKAHGGTIDLESTQNLGCSFKIKLPAL